MRDISASLHNGSYPMINYELRHDEGILVLHPEGPLEAADFISITSQVDTYLTGHGKLYGVLIHANSFPGWKDFAAMLAHLKFLKEHIQKIEKVAARRGRRFGEYHAGHCKSFRPCTGAALRFRARGYRVGLAQANRQDTDESGRVTG